MDNLVNDIFSDTLSFEDLYDFSSKLLQRLAEQDKEKKTQRMQKIMSYPIQIMKVDFSDHDVKKYNIDTHHSYYRIVHREKEKPVVKEIVMKSALMDESNFIERLNSPERYMVVETPVVGEYTKEDRKKYNYLTGNYRFENRYAVLDKQEWKIVWISEKRFGKTPVLHNNVMYDCDKHEYVYLPTMETIYKSEYFSRDIVMTKNHIVISNGYENESATVIDTNTGEAKEMD